MAGGIGSRFWPFSRANQPKQFQDIMGVGKSLIRTTFERFKGICPHENIYVVTNAAYFQQVKEHLPELTDHQILLEPVARNTAPCIAYASYKIAQKDPEARLIITPADHLILKEEKFRNTIHETLWALQEEDFLATLGIEPTRPDTGYGYIKTEDQNQKGSLRKVAQFTEKPNLPTAEKFLEEGGYFWNAGIFLWRVQSIIKSFEAHLPVLAKLFASVDHYYTDKEQEAIDQVYKKAQSISIDYGIMERANDVYCMPADIGWSDLGTWKSLYDVAAKDERNNVLHGNILDYEVSGSIIKSDNPDRLIVIQGLENYIVADNQNVLLICSKDEEQRVKEFLSDAKVKKGVEFI
jgi:mannose-1-phosphate guanylyltransferase